MTVDELLAKIEACREDVKKKAGKGVVFSPLGPVSMSVIEAIAATLKAQDERIAKLEKALREK